MNLWEQGSNYFGGLKLLLNNNFSLRQSALEIK